MQNKSTGELSFLTSLMNFAGSMGKHSSAHLHLCIWLNFWILNLTCFHLSVRVFTSVQENAPMSGIVTLANFIIYLFICNFVLLLEKSYCATGSKLVYVVNMDIFCVNLLCFPSKLSCKHSVSHCWCKLLEHICVLSGF